MLALLLCRSGLFLGVCCWALCLYSDPSFTLLATPPPPPWSTVRPTPAPPPWSTVWRTPPRPPWSSQTHPSSSSLEHSQTHPSSSSTGHSQAHPSSSSSEHSQTHPGFCSMKHSQNHSQTYPASASWSTVSSHGALCLPRLVCSLALDLAAARPPAWPAQLGGALQPMALNWP